MADAFVAEIRIVAFNILPNGWALCNGQVLPIQQNTALFSLLGVQYGGNGITTFALPNLQGCVAMHSDQYVGPGNYPVGATGGSDTVTLQNTEMPAHTHTIPVATVDSHVQAPSSLVSPAPTGRGTQPVYNTVSNTIMSPSTVNVAGSSQAHNNLQPYLVLNYMIALQGIYPPRG